MDALTTSTDALPNVLSQALSETTLSEKPDAISLKQAGNVASMTELDAPPPPTKKAFGSPDVTMDSCSEDCMSGEMQTGAGGNVMYRVEDKVKTALRVDELLFSISPDSGTEMSVTAAAGGASQREEHPEIEPVEVSTARGEVALLVAAKQRLEAQHKRIERTLRENRTGISEFREVNGSYLSLIRQTLGPVKVP